MKEREPKKKIETRLLPTKFSLTIRILVGAYLIYVSYSLIEGVQTSAGREQLFLGFFLVAFAIIGVLLIAFSGKAMTEGRYVDGALDAGEESDEDAIASDGADASEEVDALEEAESRDEDE